MIGALGGRFFVAGAVFGEIGPRFERVENRVFGNLPLAEVKYWRVF